MANCLSIFTKAKWKTTNNYIINCTCWAKIRFSNTL